MSMEHRVGRRRRWVAVGVVTALVAGLGALAPAASLAKAPAADRTSRQESRRVDAVPTPRLAWYRCYGTAQCATVRLPLDYDQPRGATTEVALLKRPARDPSSRIGTLFINPGGPGGSGTAIAFASASFLSPEVTEQFDVVGFDPRGTNFSDQVTCFTSNARQGAALAGLQTAFPFTPAEERRAVASARALGTACSTTGRPLSASMSTAEVARDMDVLRRAVGDRRLTYLGFSYGTYLGQVYANMFPDRVRAIAIDGVLDPIAWAGTTRAAGTPQTDRLRSADGAYKALRRMLVLCDRAGAARCSFAPGNPVANYDLIARRLKRHTLVLGEGAPGETLTFSYADLVGLTLSALYDPEGSDFLAFFLTDLLELTAPGAGTATGAAGARNARTAKAFATRVAGQRDRGRRPGFVFPYDNSLEAFSAVLCSDGLNPPDAASWPAAAAKADLRAKYFGRLWAWSSVQCASRTWRASDEDAYRGPFTRRTVAPVLVVGSTWDPATSYQGAVTAARLLPNSRLLSSDNWGHTAYGTSDCATGAIDAYLLDVELPARGVRCRGDAQPFEGDPTAGQGLRAASERGRRAPVVPPVLPVR